MSTPAPFPMMEKALKELLARKMGVALDSVGGDLSYDASTDDFYIWLGLVGGSTNEVSGLWTVDIDVFDNHYSQAMTRALAIESMLLRRGGHRTTFMILDNVSQNEAPMERPWEDDNAYRIGATYTFVARRRSTVGGIYVQPFIPVSGNPAPGSGYADYTHVQAEPSATWVVTHNLGSYPVPTIILTGETEPVYTDIEYLDANTLTLSFAEPVSGTVYL